MARGSRKSASTAQVANVPSKAVASVPLFSRATTANSGRKHDWSKDDIATAVHWLRQLLALVVGITWGLIPFTGFPALAAFFVIAIAAGHLYQTGFLGINQIQFPASDAMSEGLQPAFAVFMVSWIVTYSLTQFP